MTSFTAAALQPGRRGITAPDPPPDLVVPRVPTDSSPADTLACIQRPCALPAPGHSCPLQPHWKPLPSHVTEKSQGWTPWLFFGPRIQQDLRDPQEGHHGLGQMGWPAGDPIDEGLRVTCSIGSVHVSSRTSGERSWRPGRGKHRSRDTCWAVFRRPRIQRPTAEVTWLSS